MYYGTYTHIWKCLKVTKIIVLDQEFFLCYIWDQFEIEQYDCDLRYRKLIVLIQYNYLCYFWRFFHVWQAYNLIHQLSVWKDLIWEHFSYFIFSLLPVTGLAFCVWIAHGALCTKSLSKYCNSAQNRYYTRYLVCKLNN